MPTTSLPMLTTGNVTTRAPLRLRDLELGRSEDSP